MIKRLIFASCLALAATGANAASLIVAGTDAIYGAGLGGNGVSTAPQSYSFTAGAGNVLTFQSVTGTTNCCSSTPTSPPDGSSGNTFVTALNGISGITAPGVMFLAGVFVDSSNLPSGAAPATLNYLTTLSTSSASFSPLLNQAFFIGDGLTGAGSGATQSFLAPTNADTLWLGFVDSFGFNGPPSYYGDNTGSLTANFTIAGNTPVVPLPAGLPLLLGGLGLLGLVRRRR